MSCLEMRRECVNVFSVSVHWKGVIVGERRRVSSSLFHLILFGALTLDGNDSLSRNIGKEF